MDTDKFLIRVTAGWGGVLYVRNLVKHGTRFGVVIHEKAKRFPSRAAAQAAIDRISPDALIGGATLDIVTVAQAQAAPFVPYPK